MYSEAIEQSQYQPRMSTFYSPQIINVPPPNPPLNLHANSINYHCCHRHRRPPKSKKVQNIPLKSIQSNQFNVTVPVETPDDVVNVSDNDLCDNKKICFVPVQCFRFSVVFMFMSVFMLLLSSLMVCGFDGEINGGGLC